MLKVLFIICFHKTQLHRPIQTRGLYVFCSISLKIFTRRQQNQYWNLPLDQGLNIVIQYGIRRLPGFNCVQLESRFLTVPLIFLNKPNISLLRHFQSDLVICFVTALPFAGVNLNVVVAGIFYCCYGSL